MIEPPLINRAIVAGKLRESGKHQSAAVGAFRQIVAVAVCSRVVQAARKVVLIARREELGDEVTAPPSRPASQAEGRGGNGVVVTAHIARPIQHSLFVLAHEDAIGAPHADARLHPLIGVQVSGGIELGGRLLRRVATAMLLAGKGVYTEMEKTALRMVGLEVQLLG